MNKCRHQRQPSWVASTRPAALVVAVALALAACTSDDQSDAVTGSTGATTDADTASGTDTDPAADLRAGGPLINGSGIEVVGVAYQDVDYNAETAGSALRGDRDRPEFPPALIAPSDIVSVIAPDVIPAIDNPQYAPATEVDFVQPSEAVVVLEIEGDVRAYPIQIMVWHEIVNDEVGGVPVSVTYCPLCNSALAFDRRVGDRVLDFGTSGSLYQSALVMYDRQTESLWAHFTGEGVIGHYAGTRLAPIAVQTLSFEQLLAQHPDALVLTRDTGAARDYGTNPYISYDEEASGPIDNFFQGEVDPRLEPKARVVGFVRDDLAHAVDIDLAETPSVHRIPVGGDNLVVFQHPGLASALDRASVAAGRDVGQTGVFVPEGADGQTLTFSVEGDAFIDDQTGSVWTVTGRAVDGPRAGQQLTPVGHLNTFWFAWSTYYPDTVLIDG